MPRLFCLPLLFLCLAFFTAPLRADPGADFLAAREAQQKGRMDRFERHVNRLPQDYALRPYIQYWRLKGAANGREPGPSHSDPRRDFMLANPDTPLSDVMRQLLAREAAKTEDWPGFLALAAQLDKPDVELRCLTYQARMNMGDARAASEFAAQYATSRDLPSACENLYERLFEQQVLGLADRYARLRHAFEANNLRLAREINDRLVKEERFSQRMLDQAGRAPEDLIIQSGANQAEREVILYAVSRAARQDPDATAMLWESAVEAHGEEMQRYGWGQIAVQAAQRHHPRGLEWFGRAGDKPSETQAIWMARMALREGRWPEVYRAITAMPEETENEAVWRYWKARALRALNVVPMANQLFAKLSRESHYYGLLAEEELPVRLERQSVNQPVSADEVAAVAALPGIARALELRRLNLLADASAEWKWALRGADDTRLLTAAELARREGWYDRAIITAEQTREVHNFDLRYLTPYRDLARARAAENGLDEAWVYGLMRQESRFVDKAHSSAGARGLMQVMPATARWIARQMGLDARAAKLVNEPETNIRFGTFYMRLGLDSLQGSPVLATAGYNAGPGRARRWQADTPLEGAVYIESIPFTETREYVKKVMANALYYSQRLGLKPVALKERLGVVPARPGAQTDDDKS